MSMSQDETTTRFVELVIEAAYAHPELSQSELIQYIADLCGSPVDLTMTVVITRILQRL